MQSTTKSGLCNFLGGKNKTKSKVWAWSRKFPQSMRSGWAAGRRWQKPQCSTAGETTSFLSWKSTTKWQTHKRSERKDYNLTEKKRQKETEQRKKKKFKNPNCLFGPFKITYRIILSICRADAKVHWHNPPCHLTRCLKSPTSSILQQANLHTALSSWFPSIVFKPHQGEGEGPTHTYASYRPQVGVMFQNRANVGGTLLLKLMLRAVRLSSVCCWNDVQPTTAPTSAGNHQKTQEVRKTNDWEGKWGKRQAMTETWFP